MKWFMSYITVSKDGRHFFCHHVTSDPEHPLVKAARWQRQPQIYQTTIVLSFCQVPDDIPDADEMSPGIN